MHCARGLIKQELKRTKALDPVPKQIQIACPHCCRLTVEGDSLLFRDVDKSKPVKHYTDSPQGTIVMANDWAGTHEELKVSVSKFSVKFDQSSKVLKKEGIIVRMAGGSA